MKPTRVLCIEVSLMGNVNFGDMQLKRRACCKINLLVSLFHVYLIDFSNIESVVPFLDVFDYLIYYHIMLDCD